MPKRNRRAGEACRASATSEARAENGERSARRAYQINDHGSPAREPDGELFRAARSRLAGFRERFDQAQLTAIFSSLRSRSVNLTPVLFLAPNLTKQPEMTQGNELHLVGNFPTQPLQIQYEMLFLEIDGVWRLNGFSVDAIPQQAAAILSPPAANSPPPGVGSPPAGIPPVRGQARPAKPAGERHKVRKEDCEPRINSGDGCAES